MKNIFPDKYGYRVLVMRNGIELDSYVRFGDDKAAALRKAKAIRDDFIANCKAIRPREGNDTIIIRVHHPKDFHLDAGTLRVVAETLFKP